MGNKSNNTNILVLVLVFIFSAFSCRFYAQEMLTNLAPSKRSEKSKILDVDSILYKTSIFSRMLNNNAGSMFSDLANDSLGIGKFTLSAALGTGINDTIKDLQTFIVGGGNLTLRATFPIKKKSNGCAGLYFYPKISFNLPSIADNGNSLPNGNIDIGLEGHFSFFTKNKKFGLLGKFRGASGYVTNSLVNVITSNNKNIFGYGQVTFGFLIFERLIITYNKAYNFFNFNSVSDMSSASYSANFLF